MIYGEDGKLRWVDGLILDITDRKRSDVALRLTQFTVDRGSEATYWMDPDGRLIYVNDQACEALGYSREELLSMKIQEINPEFPPSGGGTTGTSCGSGEPSRPNRRTTRRTDISSRGDQGELHRIRREGIQLRLRRDITARKRDEALILLERDFSKAVLDSLPGIFYLFDRMGKFLRWNTNFEEITGYSAEEIGRMHPLDLFAGTDKALVQERITEVFVKGASEGEAELVTKSGKRMTYYFTGHAFHGKEEPCLIGTGIDISERKKLEEQLRKSQKMEANGPARGGIAHDFNNLLTGILGYANLLSINERVNPEVARAAGIIQRSAEKASQLTAQLLGFAEQGKNLNVPVELGRVIASVTGVLERTQDPCIRIVASLRPEGGCVLGDPSQLDQVVMNLAINACDAMPRGGQLKFTTEPMTIDEAFCRERDWMSPGSIFSSPSPIRASAFPRRTWSGSSTRSSRRRPRERGRGLAVNGLRDREEPRRLHRRPERGGGRHCVQGLSPGEFRGRPGGGGDGHGPPSRARQDPAGGRPGTGPGGGQGYARSAGLRGDHRRRRPGRGIPVP